MKESIYIFGTVRINRVVLICMLTFYSWLGAAAPIPPLLGGRAAPQTPLLPPKPTSAE